MRALCGAIITAGALIGLGLAAIGLGVRYQHFPYQNASGETQWVLFKHLDTGLMVAVAVLLMMMVVGLAATFLGLAYHHHRRHHEMLHHAKAGGAVEQRTAV